MQTGVQAHQPVAARPVDGDGDAVADLRGHVAVQHVQDALTVVGVDGVRQRQDAAVRQGQRAAIARLSAAAGIEDGFVQFDAFRVDSDDGGFALAQIGFVVEALAGGGHGVSPDRIVVKGRGARCRPGRAECAEGAQVRVLRPSAVSICAVRRGGPPACSMSIRVSVPIQASPCRSSAAWGWRPDSRLRVSG
ncbi:hypothetical protein D3C72_1310570 [compost metagenome]